MTTPRPGWVAIAGPTASGKTALALALAQALAPNWPVEIISVDSALVYRGMDIGTAKPTAEERALAPHHLIDIRDPSQTYSAAEFVRDATALVADIQARGHLPLLVGGTMLYFKALFDGLDDLPPAQPALRAAIEAEAQAYGWPALHQQLVQVDPATAQRLAPNDSQRIGRALEVFRATGQPLSQLHQRAQRAPSALQIGGQPGPLLSLEPNDRGWLHQRIALRFDQMLQQGLLDEVRTLRARGDLSPELPAMRCVGYRQTWEALEQAERDGLGTEPVNAAWVRELRDRGIFATRQLAKRQLTWLRSMPLRQPLACDASDMEDQAFALLRSQGLPLPP